MATRLRAMDIGANLLDDMFAGVYHGKRLHEPDLAFVLQRAAEAGVDKVVATCGNEADAARGALLAGQFPRQVRSTMGIHPTEANGATEGWPERLLELHARHGDAIVAVGEAGMDADRVSFAPLDVQRRVFEQHFSLCERTGLPMFIHARGCHDEVLSIIAEHRAQLVGGGVVHSFDGSMAHLHAVVSLGLHVGLNGCSLRTADNLAVARAVPVDRLLVESDAPWCSLKPTHASHALNTLGEAARYPRVKKDKLAGSEGKAVVRDRNEPTACVEVLGVLASLRGVPVEELARQVYANSTRLFRWPAAAPPSGHVQITG